MELPESRRSGSYIKNITHVICLYKLPHEREGRRGESGCQEELLVRAARLWLARVPDTQAGPECERERQQRADEATEQAQDEGIRHCVGPAGAVPYARYLR